MNKDREWYTECTDRCSICFRLPLMINLKHGNVFYCRDGCDNRIEPNNNIALAVTDWNIKQIKMRGRIK
jgi:hypothetical protein